MTELVLVKTDQVYDYCLQLCDILDDRFRKEFPTLNNNTFTVDKGRKYYRVWAIAVNLREMFRLKVPIIATVIGEGGSGGALGIGVADRLLMFEHSVYTVASPEACASILWRDAGKAPEAASALKIT